MGVDRVRLHGLRHVIANSALLAMTLLEQPESVNALQVGKNFRSLVYR